MRISTPLMLNEMDRRINAIEEEPLSCVERCKKVAQNNKWTAGYLTLGTACFIAGIVYPISVKADIMSNASVIGAGLIGGGIAIFVMGFVAAHHCPCLRGRVRY